MVAHGKMACSVFPPKRMKIDLSAVCEAQDTMSEQYITIKEDELWLVVPVVHPDHDDGLITIRDSVGGDTIIARDDIPTLIEALQKLIAKPPAL
jgi:hypothetical protein